jgi:tetratricopeptide (TPR) repeat protein
MSHFRKAIVLASLLVLAHAAAADRTRALQLAHTHFAAGLIAQNKGDFATAIAEYEDGYALVQLPGFLFNLGQVHRLAGHDQKALDYYQEYLRHKPTGTASDQARAYVAELGARLDAAAKPAPAPDPKPIVARPLPPAPTPAPVPKPAPPVVARQAPAPVPTHPGRTLRIAGIVTAGLGVGLVAGGVAYGLRAKADADRISGARDQWTAQRNMYVLYAAGAGALIGGGVLYYLGVRARREAPVSVAVAPSAALVTLQGSFR